MNSEAESARLKEQVDRLQSFQIPGSNLQIDFRGYCTMIDGKGIIHTLRLQAF